MKSFHNPCPPEAKLQGESILRLILRRRKLHQQTLKTRTRNIADFSAIEYPRIKKAPAGNPVEAFFEKEPYAAAFFSLPSTK